MPDCASVALWDTSTPLQNPTSALFILLSPKGGSQGCKSGIFPHLRMLRAKPCSFLPSSVMFFPFWSKMYHKEQNMILVYYWIRPTHPPDVCLRTAISVGFILLLNTALIISVLLNTCPPGCVPCHFLSSVGLYRTLEINYTKHDTRPTKPHQQTTHRALSEVHLPHLTRKSDKGKPRAVLPFPTITTKSCLSCTGGTHSLIIFHEQSSLQGCAVSDTPLKRVHCSSQIPARQCKKHSSDTKLEWTHIFLWKQSKVKQR